jgi:Rer1 family
LGIYLLNLFLAFLQPKFDPSINGDEGLEDGESSQNVLPTKQDEEFRPFIRRLPEFKFWHSATRAISISFLCSFFEIFNLPVFWPVLVMYWLILFSLTSKQSHLHTHSPSAFHPTFSQKEEVVFVSAPLIIIVKTVRRQIQHMIKYRYVPFSFGKAKYSGANKS